MTPATIAYLTILAAPLTLMVAVLGPLLWELYRIDRAGDREWAELVRVVEAARRDFDVWETEVAS